MSRGRVVLDSVGIVKEVQRTFERGGFLVVQFQDWVARLQPLAAMSQNHRSHAVIDRILDTIAA
jgi:hypothetical protein